MRLLKQLFYLLKYILLENVTELKRSNIKLETLDNPIIKPVTTTYRLRTSASVEDYFTGNGINVLLVHYLQLKPM